MKIVESGAALGARIEDIDLAHPFSGDDYRSIEQALGKYGVVSFPRQDLSAEHLKTFAARFGSLEVNVANLFYEPGIPEVMILSNLVEDGKPIGLSDAGQSWHTDMSYSRMIAFTNVLYGLRIPVRDGKPLGNTEFCNM